jgi:hypothetical protein
LDTRGIGRFREETGKEGRRKIEEGRRKIEDLCLLVDMFYLSRLSGWACQFLV